MRVAEGEPKGHSKRLPPTQPIAILLVEEHQAIDRMGAPTKTENIGSGKAVTFSVLKMWRVPPKSATAIKSPF